MINSKTKGDNGEDIAMRYLEVKGYTIKKRNFHFGRLGEIDIVALDGDTYVFVEVKTRHNAKFGNPLASITPGKQRKLKKATEGYLLVNKLHDVPCRFDVIVIDFTKITPEISHYTNAF